MEHRGIVVGVDGSAPAAAAMAWAAALAAATGAQITAVVVDDPRAPLQSSEQTIVEVALHGVDDALRRGIVVRRCVGDVATELGSAAGSGLLVVGTHKTGYLRGRVLGSRSLGIAAAATGPVAIVPAGSLEARQGIVAGLEVHLDARPVVLAAVAAARRTGDELLIVHSLDDMPGDLVADDGTTTVDAAHVRTAAAAHLAAAEGAPSVRTRVSARVPAEAFLDASSAARLLVVGASRDERRGGFAGSTVHDVVLNTNAPLLIVPTTMLG